MSTSDLINKAINGLIEGKAVAIRAHTRERAFKLVGEVKRHPNAPRRSRLYPLGPKEFLTAAGAGPGGYGGDNVLILDDRKTTGDA